MSNIEKPQTRTLVRIIKTMDGQDRYYRVEETGELVIESQINAEVVL